MSILNSKPHITYLRALCSKELEKFNDARSLFKQIQFDIKRYRKSSIVSFIFVLFLMPFHNDKNIKINHLLKISTFSRRKFKEESELIIEKHLNSERKFNSDHIQNMVQIFSKFPFFMRLNSCNIVCLKRLQF